jgi:hypothetical protein
MKNIRLNRPLALATVVLAAFVMFTRLWNLENTARFTQDEANDLMRMHTIWKDKDLTLIGPISNDHVKVFGSLTFYVLLPFALAYHFAPVGPAVGTAFYGVLTTVLFWLIVRERFPTPWMTMKKTVPVLQWTPLLLVALSCIWTPLLLVQRWAWNPHLVLMWIVGAIWLSSKRTWWAAFLCGLSLGLTIHHHYIAVFTAAPLVMWWSIVHLRAKHWLLAALLCVGFVAALAPFVLFDLTHPPGLFFGKYLQKNQTPNVRQFVGGDIPKLMWLYTTSMLKEFRIPAWLQFPVFVSVISLVVSDIVRKRVTALLWLTPVVAQFFVTFFIDGYYVRYVVAALFPILLWLGVPRKRWSRTLAQGLCAMLLIPSLFLLPQMLTQPIATPTPRVVAQATEAIRTMMASQPKNPNIATLTGKDLDAIATKYRDVLSMYDLRFRAESEYDATENLFVISDQPLENIRKDPNIAMIFFREGKLKQEIKLAESPWSVFWFTP